MMAQVCSLVVTNMLKFKVRRKKRLPPSSSKIREARRPARTRTRGTATGRGRRHPGSEAHVNRRHLSARSQGRREIGRNDVCLRSEEVQKMPWAVDGASDESEDATA